MRIKYYFFFSFLVAFFLTSCGVMQDNGTRTMYSQIESFHSSIEKDAALNFKDSSYKPIAYGELTVYKPPSFVQLDSVYRIKQNYLDKNDLRGLRQSGIEDLIPGYRAAAQADIEEVQYEIEHIFQTQKDDLLSIHHYFYLFDYKDSLISATPFYSFSIPLRHKDLYYAYEFEVHFVDERDLFISIAERDFIRFFKQRENELIGEKELEPFMRNTMLLMEIASKAGTVDFRQVGKWRALTALSRKDIEIVVNEFGELFVLKEDDNIVGYEMEIKWMEESTKNNYASTYSFSPYLEVTNVKTIAIEG